MRKQRNTEPSPTEPPGRTEVLWEDYDGMVQTRFHDLTTAGDCGALQNECDIADANNDITRTAPATITPTS